MPVWTFEGVVENGQIRLKNPVSLPEHAKVYVVVPEADAPLQARVLSPRLAHSEQAVDFAKQIVDGEPHAGL